MARSGCNCGTGFRGRDPLLWWWKRNCGFKPAWWESVDSQSGLFVVTQIRDLDTLERKDGFPPETAPRLRENSGKLLPLQSFFLVDCLTERLKVFESQETSQKIPPGSNT